MNKIIKSKPHLSSLTLEEESDRHRLERKVEQAFYIAGSCLAELRDRRLYRSTHSSFEEYCQDRFGMKRRHPYRLIDAAKVVNNILEVCPQLSVSDSDTKNKTQIIPTSEWQARPLTKLTPTEQKQAWAKAVELAGNRVPSGKIVSQVVSKMMCPNRTQTQSKFKVGQRIKIKSNHPLLGGNSGTIKQIPNRANVIVELDNGHTELVNQEYIELELDSSIQELPPEGLAYTAGMRLEYNVRLSQETWDNLNIYAQSQGVASLDGAISRLLEKNSRNH